MDVLDVVEKRGCIVLACVGLSSSKPALQSPAPDSAAALLWQGPRYSGPLQIHPTESRYRTPPYSGPLQIHPTEPPLQNPPLQSPPTELRYRF